MGRLSIAVCIVFVSSCFSTTRYDVANAQRTASINSKYAAESKRVEQEYAALIRSIEEFKKHLIPIKEGSSYAPRARVSEQEEIVACKNACQGAAQCLKETCEAAHVSALMKAYFQADIDWVVTQLDKGNDTDMESLLAFSHNQSILGYIEKETKEVLQLREVARQQVEARRQNAIMASWQQRDVEVAVAREEYSAKMRLVAGVLHALGNSRQPSSSTAASSNVAVYSGAVACSSDYSCGYGYQCVKPLYSSTGRCMKSVNEYGNQVFKLPRLESVQVNVSTGCKAVLDCPIGFRCDLTTGACLR